MMALLRRAARLCAVAAASFAIAVLAAPYCAAFEAAQGKDKPAQVSDGETKAVAKINAAPDPAAKMVAVQEFVKKYPKSSLRGQVLSSLAGEINKVEDGAKRISLFEGLLTVFTGPADAEVINPMLVDAYVNANRLDDGFAFGAKVVQNNPNDLATLTSLTMIGSYQASQQNPKYVKQAQESGAKAIAIIESGKKPDSLDESRWNEYQTKLLPQIYQRMGLMSMVTGNKEDARAKLEKAATLNPSDPINYYWLAGIMNEEYTQKAKEFQAQSPGPLKDVKLKEAEATMDKVIDLWARVAGISEGNPQLKQLHDATLQDLQAYFKYRHGGKLDGMQELVDKYKKSSGQ
jgi:tetratricopeptide (TPR) repeat protein